MFRTVNLFTVLVMVSGLGCFAEDPDADTDEIVQNLVEAGYPAGDIEIIDGQVYVQDDGHVTLQASREMLEVTGTAEQYRTNNLVDTGVVHKICVNPTSQFSSKARLSQGLNLAIENYNQLGLEFTMERGPTTGCDANITAQVAGGPPGGVSGFPSGGLPYGTITIYTTLNKYSVDVNEHVIAHELGHCVGMRHTDYYNRSISCGSGGNEGEGSVGAVHIPGTPTDATLGGSVMNSCFRSSETGEWLGADATAFQTLY